MNEIDHLGKIALRKIGNPISYSVCGWEILDDGSVLVEMMQEHPHVDGKKRKWTGDKKKACVSRVELAEEERRFESETGRCAQCNGTGKALSGWSAASGKRFSPCTRCNATGKPKIN